jgi:agmatinase
MVIVPTAFEPEADLPTAILAAGTQLSGFEPLLQVDIDRQPVGRVPSIVDELPFGMSEAAVRSCLQQLQWPLLLPSSLTAVWGGIRAVWKQTPNLSVVYCSAHAGILPSPQLYATDAWVEQLYRYRIPVAHIGLRSCSAAAWEWFATHHALIFPAGQSWNLSAAIAALPHTPIFMVVDCSILDPSSIASVPQPEPGGFTWNQLAEFVRAVFAERSVVGAALGGLSEAADGSDLSVRMAARLVNWLLACHVAHINRDGAPLSEQNDSLTE